MLFKKDLEFSIPNYAPPKCPTFSLYCMQIHFIHMNSQCMPVSRCIDVQFQPCIQNTWLRIPNVFFLKKTELIALLHCIVMLTSASEVTVKV